MTPSLANAKILPFPMVHPPERSGLALEADGLGARVVERAQSAWPSLDVEPSSFLAHVSALCTRQGVEADGVLDLCIEDLYLAHSCSRHDPQALRAFENEVGPELRIALLKFRVLPEHHDDVRQDLWEKLFVGAGRPKILEYTGRGKLRTWFRVTAVRALLDDHRRKKIDGDEELLGEIAAPTADPELAHLRALYSHEFNAAFEQAVAELTPEDRNTLRSYYAKSMTIDQIAVAFGVHRATAARRVNGAREALLGATRRLLAEKLRLDTAGLDSVLRLIESGLHVSVRRLLG